MFFILFKDEFKLFVYDNAKVIPFILYAKMSFFLQISPDSSEKFF